MKILKFGGSALSSHLGLQRALEIVDSSQTQEAVIVVVSALEMATDQLLQIAHIAGQGEVFETELGAFEKEHFSLVEHWFSAAARETLRRMLDPMLSELREILEQAKVRKDVSKKSLDLILSFGERLSSLIVAEFFKTRFPDCALLDARSYIRTNENFGSARVLLEATEKLIRTTFPSTTRISVLPGFIAASEKGDTTTLGRGGSDYTASLLAAALGCREIEIWTTVDGIMTADPLKVRHAISIPELSYEEAMELGHFGAELICATAIQPAKDRLIPIRVRNFLNPDFPGSSISTVSPAIDFPITGICSIGDICLFRLQGSGLVGISGTARRLFDALSRHEINVTLISQASSEHSICFAIRPESESVARAAVLHEFADEMASRHVELISQEEPHAVVAVVGANMRHRIGLAGKIFQALGKNGINIVAIAQGSSELNISLVIAKSDETKALNSLHDAFFLSEKKTINLFCLGVGKVGRALLEQIASQVKALANHHIELRLVGLANSKRMMFDPHGLPLSEWEGSLQGVLGETFGIERFISRLKTLNLPNSIFVDCTASEQIAEQYAKILQQSISIVTPNKRANSGPYERYRELKQRASRANVKFFYETTVGAGLPIIGTLSDLILSGDEIIRIEAVLSGTLSFIFNSFKHDTRFSEVVKRAQALGYTEPDPREDLSGKDVGRKLLILAREMGLPFEEDLIEIQSLVPESCSATMSLEQFYQKLALEDENREQERAKAEASGRALRYVAKIEKEKASVSLIAIGSDHPFYALSGSDNVVSFTTKRYFDRPLVVKGPGAGTDVTAAGVLADIVRAISYLA